MKKICYIFLLMLVSEAALANGKKQIIKKDCHKVVPAKQKQSPKKNRTKAERKPVPKVFISNPDAMNEV